NFYSPELGGKMMYGFRKRDGLIFPCKSADVCRVKNGSTNGYLLHDRVIEKFLRTIEPGYNQAVNDLREDRVNPQAIYVIAGFTAFVTSCSPTAMRLGEDPLRHAVISTARILEERGLVDKAPDVLGGKTLTELVDDGLIKVDIDQKYPQAIGISQIVDRTFMLGNSRWELIHNDDEGSPFLTSDFASAIEVADDQNMLNRIVPLSPDFAIRILLDKNFKEKGNGKDFSDFRFNRLRYKGTAIRQVNTLIAQCAEELIFFRDNHKWIPRFLGNCSSFWIEPKTIAIPTSRGIMNSSTMRICRKASAAIGKH
ncbi:MAG: DUF4238 domain-containing protein, partial [Beijerinckiaceae bacterium]